MDPSADIFLSAAIAKLTDLLTFFFSLLSQKLAAASDQIAELSNDLNDREGHLQFYEDKLAQAAKDSKDVEERYEEMELRLSSVCLMFDFYDIGIWILGDILLMAVFLLLLLLLLR
jgi:hypothetical protein